MESVKVVNVSSDFFNMLSEGEKESIQSYLSELGCSIESREDFPFPDIQSLVFGADAIELVEIISTSGKDGLDLLAKHDNEIMQKVIECINIRYAGPALLICLLALSVKTSENKKLIISSGCLDEKDAQGEKIPFSHSVDRNAILTSLLEKLKFDKSLYANRKIYGASIAEVFTSISCFSSGTPESEKIMDLWPWNKWWRRWWNK
jgi:hypothetical protein